MVTYLRLYLRLLVVLQVEEEEVEPGRWVGTVEVEVYLVTQGEAMLVPIRLGQRFAQLKYIHNNKVKVLN